MSDDSLEPGGSPASPAGRVIVLTGPPGAGKSTVARRLTDRLSPSVHLHADDFWHAIRRGRIEPYLPAAHRQNTTVTGVVARAAADYATGGYQVVCDGIVGPWFLDVFRSASTALGVELHYLVLRPDAATGLARATGRSAAGALTDSGPVRALHQQFSSLGGLEPHVLDSTHLSADATTDEALRGIDSGRYLLR